MIVSTYLDNQNAVVPAKKHLHDAGYDLYANESVIIGKGEIKIIETGIHLDIPNPYYGKIESRSSLAAKGIIAIGGVIDSGYIGPIKVVLANISEEDYEVRLMDRIAQIIFARYYDPLLLTGNGSYEKDETDRNSNGFGSTGR